MTLHFQRELTQLRQMILSLGAAVEDAISHSITALLRRDEDLATQVLKGDAAIDQMEIDIEEECLKTLALYQPVAHDLRFIVAVLKMNNDLERMGDHAANIAKRARFLARQDDYVERPQELETMAQRVKTMVNESLVALIKSDGELARRVCETDAIVDAHKRNINDELRNRVLQPGEPLSASLLKLMDIPRHLERIADLATNVAEDVIYMTEGAIVRHRHDEEG